ncbi:uncharacterized protein [Elaeis guineensis]|uniref:uncharacterized protein isoform X2 n=1 Tax=Elaeis guineensis var. tenera TaxID=51953 RepID=UPI003C6D0A88
MRELSQRLTNPLANGIPRRRIGMNDIRSFSKTHWATPRARKPGRSRGFALRRRTPPWRGARSTPSVSLDSVFSSPISGPSSPLPLINPLRRSPASISSPSSSLPRRRAQGLTCFCCLICHKHLFWLSSLGGWPAILTSNVVHWDLSRMFSLILCPLNDIKDMYYPSFAEWVACKIKIRLLAAHASIKCYVYQFLRN